MSNTEDHPRVISTSDAPLGVPADAWAVCFALAVVVFSRVGLIISLLIFLFSALFMYAIHRGNPVALTALFKESSKGYIAGVAKRVDIRIFKG